MRVNDEIKKSGYFWLPSAADKKVPGTLSIIDGGNIELEILGLFDESIEGINNIQEDNKLPRVIGTIEGNNFITLENCFYKSINTPLFGIQKNRIHAEYAFIGICYDECERALFNTFKFTVEGIDEWTGSTGFTIQRQNDSLGFQLNYSIPEDIFLGKIDDMSLSITFEASYPNTPIKFEVKASQKAYFKLISNSEIPIDNFIFAAYKLTNLVGFALDQTVCIHSATLTSNSISVELGNGKKIPQQISVYYPSLPHTKEPPKFYNDKILFNLITIREDVEKIIKNWFKAYEIIEPALNLYFSTKTGGHKYVDAKFLALVQSFETYHRRTSTKKLMDDDVFSYLINNLINQCPKEHKEWLRGRLTYGNELSLSQRIKEVIEPFKELLGTSSEIKKLVRNIVDTRNYLTHYSESLNSQAVKHEALWFLCAKLETIFQLHLLQIIGFSKSEIRCCFEKNYRMQQKLRS